MSDAQFGAWAGLLCAVAFLTVSVTRNRRLTAEQIGFTVAGALACQNILRTNLVSAGRRMRKAC